MEQFIYADVPLTNRLEFLMAMGVKVYYHPGHGWAIPESGNTIRVGIDDFAQKLVGRIDAITCPEVASAVTQGERGWTLHVDGKSIDMLSPVDGTVAEINEGLLNSPQRIGDDPYGHYWLMKVQAPLLSANLKCLLSGGAARRWMAEVSADLLSRADYRLGPLSQDGGTPVVGIAKHLDRDRWEEIAREFLLTRDAAGRRR